MKMEVDVLHCDDEEYVIKRARSALKTDPLSAKAWMLTAKTLYPNNFDVQFEAYNIEKCAGHIKEAAKCFSDLIGKFQQQPEFWEEINRVTTALRTENAEADKDKVFLCEMFKHISLDVQHKLLLLTADHCEDTQEHCKLLLLLLQKFPSSISTHGPGLVETLLSAEKHNLAGNMPNNCYRKLLICDLLPLLNSTPDVNFDLPPKLVYKLLHKAIEYHLCNLKENIVKAKDSNSPIKVDESWTKLFQVVEFIGKQLGWEPYLTSFGSNWCKESYWQKLLTFCQSQSLNLEDPNMLKQLIYCLTLFLVYCLHQYVVSLNSENTGGLPHASYLLVEAFVDANLPAPQQHSDLKSKKRKTDIDVNSPIITTEKPNLKNITSNFLMAVNCWDLLHSAEHLNREFMKLSGILMLEPWLTSFLVDYLIYKGKNEEALKRLDNDGNIPILVKHILKASIHYIQFNYLACFEDITEAMNVLPPVPHTGSLSMQLTTGGNQRHLHYLPLTQISVIQYCAKLLLRSIKMNGLKGDMAIGHCFVLMQVDWPQEEDLLPVLIEEIKQARSFYYYLFQNYIVQVDILEELAYLWSNQGGQVSLEIVLNSMTRRMGTRGADKGMREEIKQAIRGQVRRCNEPMHELVFNFITQEKHNITQSLV